jgi:transcriptional regulator with PAS, ATPase and Fis domain
MHNLNNFISQQVLNAFWAHSTCGIVAIDINGHVLAANPAFVHCTGIEISTVIGMSEADFNHALLNSQVLECRRIEVVVDDLRAIYQIRCNCCSTQYNSPDPKLSHVAEMLREPLASIYGFTELLLTQNYDEETRVALTSALFEQVEVMSNLINTQLDLRNIKLQPKNQS